MKLTKIALTYLLTLMSMSLAAASVSVPEDKTQPTEASLTTTNLVQARQIYQKYINYCSVHNPKTRNGLCKPY